MNQPARVTPRRTSVLHGCISLLLGGLLYGMSQCAPLFSTASSAPDNYAQEAAPKPVAPPKAGTFRGVTRHLASLGASRWHHEGVRGQHVKVAILDSGFLGYQAQLGRALPAQVTTRSFRSDGKLEFRDSQHGVLCAEVIHALAPEAELLLINWEPNDPPSFLQAVRWAKEQGAKVISCSLIMPSWSDGEGGGTVNQGLVKILGNGKQDGDMLFFASAGNTAQRHWCGTFTADTAGYHCWKNGNASNTLTPWGKERVAVELYGPSAGEFEMSVVDPHTGHSVGEQQMRHLGQKPSKVNCLLVRFTPQPGQTYQIRVRSKKPGATASHEKLHLVVLGGDLQYSCPNGSISCPADCPAACAVGAVNQDGQRWHYSSCGPNSALPKPDYVAVVPFPSTWRPQPFGGTSAAAPQAAGMAALWLSKHAGWTPTEVKDAMRKSAVDLGPPGHDFETGYGMVRLP